MTEADSAADGFDAILCCTATDVYWPQMVELVRPFGTICSIDETDAQLDLRGLKPKSAGMVWEFMFTAGKVGGEQQWSQHRLLSAVAALVDEGRLRSTLSTRLPPLSVDSLRAGHALVDGGGMIGKCALSVDW